MEDNKTKVGLGTVYDLNRAAMADWKPLSPAKEKKAVDNLWNYFNTHHNKYFMMLCNELKDYTVFHYTTENKKGFSDTIIECLKNRGNLISIDKASDGIAMELYIRYYDDETIHCYFLFPYDEAIVEV